MFNRLGRFVIRWTWADSPWTNVYGLSRTVIASMLALTLAVNHASILFRPAAGISEYPQCSTSSISIFCLVPNDYLYLNIVKWIAVLLLVVVASGWRPRITGIVQAWIAYSIQASAVTLDGGEQVAMVISILLLPLTLTDPRRWHWSNLSKADYYNSNIYSALIAKLNLVFIRIQVSIIYFHAFVGKLNEEEWLNGTAVYYYLNDIMLGSLPFLSNSLNLLLTSKFVVVITWGTLVIEAMMFIGLFVSKKYWKYLLYLGMLLHSGIAVVIGLYTFSLIMFAALLLYFRPVESEINFKSLGGIKNFNFFNTKKQFFKGGDVEFKRIK
ncbi:sporulation-delaying protein SdpB family protein [Sediminibacillus halophilus]|uniref:Antimicrobial peptide system protein, SdpB family n=1 Tax=Sediminibacillus halophilus TaxID=482461 RepID=A0A1G9NGJ4_9BACI|nr:sporulation-delaying protein SdpB family protein [Sediminibacillus halophilus]SDL85672.1 antimicrobial peptide system protein, SdpB family [Sediminibacillus halophilus]